MSFFRPVLNEYELTEQQWRIIRILADRGTVDFQDLAESACILRPSLTGILTRLEKAGYVIKLKPTNDQRRVFVALTAQGREIYDAMSEKIEARYRDIESQFSTEKLEQLMRLLAELKNIKHR